jgi:molybdopterin-containing oxidoreductase family iron-sulfur binding subunit
MHVSSTALSVGTSPAVPFGLSLPGLALILLLFASLTLAYRLARRRTKGRQPSEIRATSDAGLIDRRTALHLFGMTALTVGPLGVIPRLLDKFLAQPGLPVALQTETLDLRLRQWAMIIDLRFCDGCQSQGTPPQCTLGCIEGHLAPEPMEWIEVFEFELSGNGTHFLPVPCQQCQNPPCVNVCPVGATFSTPEGLVLIDQDRCIGCRICMAACPYDRRYFNWGDPPVPPDALLAEYDVELQVPALKGTVMKCDFCPDMIRANTLPYCVQACPNDAIYYGDLEEDVATNGVKVVAISHFLANHDAFRLKEELGTQPRVFYLPGHGEGVGRDPTNEGRLATRWPWIERVKGAVTWSR